MGEATLLRAAPFGLFALHGTARRPVLRPSDPQDLLETARAQCTATSRAAQERQHEEEVRTCVRTCGRLPCAVAHFPVRHVTCSHPDDRH